MNNAKILFMGTPNFACGILETLVEMGLNVVGVVSQPDKKVGRKQELKQTPVKQTALKYELPVYQPIKIRTDYQDILALDYDCIVTCAYGQLIPNILLDKSSIGNINVHASLLPKYRGGAPIHRAIINGDLKTGVTLIEMVHKMDAGCMYAKKEIDILPDETTSELFERLMVTGQQLIKENIILYLNKQLIGEEQIEEEVVFAYNIQREEEFVSFRRPSNVVYNHIRGLLDYPVGYGIVEGKKIKIYQAKILTNHVEAGKIIGYHDGYFEVGTETESIAIYELQLPGKKRMLAKDFFNGQGKSFIGKYFE